MFYSSLLGCVKLDDKWTDCFFFARQISFTFIVKISFAFCDTDSGGNMCNVTEA